MIYHLNKQYWRRKARQLTHSPQPWARNAQLRNPDWRSDWVAGHREFGLTRSTGSWDVI